MMGPMIGGGGMMGMLDVGASMDYLDSGCLDMGNNFIGNDPSLLLVD